MATPFMGQITVLGFGFVPKNYAGCNGQLMAINQNQALFSLLMTQYGGDGITTFALPNLQSCSPVGAGGSADGSWQPPPYVQGQIAGTEMVTLQAENAGMHVHYLMATTTPGVDGDPVDGELMGTTKTPIYVKPQNGVQLLGGVLGNGGSAPHPNVQPFLVINMCVALSGLYPSKN